MKERLTRLSPFVDLITVLAGCVALSISGFLVSAPRGFAVLGSCLVGIPLLFSFVLPLLARKG